jgi:hypothetical protein
MITEQQNAAEFNFPGVPLPDPRRELSIGDRRRDLRVLCRGRILLDQQTGISPLRGELIDISSNGFRVSFAHPVPAVGAEVEFKHRFFRGRARFVWILRKGDHYEAGCKVLRD